MRLIKKNGVRAQNTSPLPIILFRRKKYRLVSLYESFLIFHFCTIIVSFNFALSASHIIYGHFGEKAERFGATKNIQHIPLFVLSSGSYYSSARTDQWLSSLCGDSGQRKGGNVKSVSVRRQEIATIIILREKTP